MNAFQYLAEIWEIGTVLGLQGTLLSPLIFLFFVNDFSEKLKSENDSVQFADDNSIICNSESNNINPLKNEILEEGIKNLRETTHINRR